MTKWKDAAVAACDGALPVWVGPVPLCEETCPHHDGKRCRLMGFRPSRMCEPVVSAMGDALDSTEHTEQQG